MESTDTRREITSQNRGVCVLNGGLGAKRGGRVQRGIGSGLLIPSIRHHPPGGVVIAQGSLAYASRITAAHARILPQILRSLLT